MRIRSHATTLAACVLAAACGSSVRASLDAGSDAGHDTPGDTGLDYSPDPGNPQCSDGIDNDGDDLVDMEDFDCESPADGIEGPDDGCTTDNHCAAGWEECDHASGLCYDPPFGGPCDPCHDSADCGDGVTGEDPDRDFCLIYGTSGHCTKDCRGEFDCPRGFWCDPGEDGEMPGYCRTVILSCTALDIVGTSCMGEPDCYGAMACHGGICTYECETEHQCVEGTSCTAGWCTSD
jgi:hypothetical protein